MVQEKEQIERVVTHYRMQESKGIQKIYDVSRMSLCTGITLH